MAGVNIGILGLGTVGAGTVNVLNRNQDEISRRAGCKITITHALVNDINKSRDCDTSSITLTENPKDILTNPDIHIILELMGGEDLALEYCLEAIKNNKHIVTANKALIAKHGNQIFEQASEKNIMVNFEAAVAGGIPIIKAIREGYTGNQIQKCMGIINGTSNYILTQMQNQKRDFDEVLSEAQRLGYAESDPSFDIDGIDQAHKITILSSIAFGIPLQFDKTHVEGIRDITPLDIQYADELGFIIKPIAVAEKQDNKIQCRVHTALLPKDFLLSHVNGVMNAVMVNGDAVGETLHYGAGAGADPTASSVVADLVDIVRTLTSDPENRVPHLAFQPNQLQNTPIDSIENLTCAYYLRLSGKNQAGVLAQITNILGECDISIEAFLQKNFQDNYVPIVIKTYPVLESKLNQALDKLNKLDTIQGTITKIRIENIHG